MSVVVCKDMTDAEAELESFIVRFLPEVAAVGREAVAKLRQRLPEADVLVYDNYNALAVGFAPGEKSSQAIMSIAFYPRWCSLFLTRRVDDPEKRLQGTGGVVGHIVLKAAADLNDAYVCGLIDQAMIGSKTPFDPAHKGRLIIKSVSAKQRPRRP